VLRCAEKKTRKKDLKPKRGPGKRLKKRRPEEKRPEKKKICGKEDLRKWRKNESDKGTACGNDRPHKSESLC
jgi:hypothetical protein